MVADWIEKSGCCFMKGLSNNNFSCFSMKYANSLSFARKMDRLDPLKSFRSKFHIPNVNGKPCLYFAGNSLGLQPRATQKFLNEELKDWAELGVEGHLHARRPWLYYHKFSKKA